MLSFISFLSEETHLGGIAHIEHPSDMIFHGAHAAHKAINTLKGVVSGRAPITRKIDDKMSYHAIRTPEGKIGVKYKGSGAKYNYSHSDIEAQHGHKPYLEAPLKALHSHLHKVLPKTPGEYQGGFMSTKDTRHDDDEHIGHTPNTVKYHAHKSSAEGKKLSRSHVSTVIHTQLKGPQRRAVPITNNIFHSHPDVHMVPHIVSDEERKINPTAKKEINSHIRKAKELTANHDFDHLHGHLEHLQTYVNSTHKPTVSGYKKHVAGRFDKAIDKLKMPKSKAAKEDQKNGVIKSISKNADHFKKTFQIHGHIQHATNLLARELDKNDASGIHSTINGTPGGEGYVARGLKVVDRQGFSTANRARRDAFKKAAAK